MELEIDYRELLRKYMALVIKAEGVAFETEWTLDTFSEREIAELKAIAESI